MRGSNFRRRQGCWRRGFTLVEVLLAIGILALASTSLIMLMVAGNRLASDAMSRTRAVHLAEPIEVELQRLLRTAPGSDPWERLASLAARMPSEAGPAPLRFIGDADGLRVVCEEDADDCALGIAPDERFFLAEVRANPPLSGAALEAGCLVATAWVWWPYTHGKTSGAVTVDPSQMSFVVLTLAVNP